MLRPSSPPRPRRTSKATADNPSLFFVNGEIIGRTGRMPLISGGRPTAPRSGISTGSMGSPEWPTCSRGKTRSTPSSETATSSTHDKLRMVSADRPPRVVGAEAGGTDLVAGRHGLPVSSCPWKKSSMTFFHLENLRFSRVLRTRDRLVRSGRHFIHSLLGDPWRRVRCPRLRRAEPGQRGPSA